MRAAPLSSLLFVLCVCHGQNNIVRYEPLKNKDREAEYDAWAKGSDFYVRSNGLAFEWHNVTTTDNVTLKMHRLWNPRVNGTKIPVLMLSGTTTDGDIFLMNRPESSFTMTLANLGYDVFLGNYRTSWYSDLTQAQSRKTSIDDNTFLDSAPMFDHVLKVTKQPKIHLIGYSKGSTVALELLANKVEYNDKVRLLVLLSPVSYIEKPNPLLGFGMDAVKALIYLGGRTAADIFDTNFFLKFLRVKPVPQLLQFVADVSPLLIRCIWNFLWTGRLDCISKLNFDTDLIEKVLTRGFPALISSSELTQYAQNSKGKSFMSFSTAWLDRDWKALLFDVYPGTTKYDLANVKVPVAILQVSVELFSQPEDYKRLRNKLCPRIIEGELSPHKYVFQVGLPNYQHVDPFLGRNSTGVYGDAFYMIMREFDIARDSSLQNVLGYIDADFSNLIPQPCG